MTLYFSTADYNKLFFSLIILLGFVILGWIVNSFFKKIIGYLVGKTETTIDDQLVKIFRYPIFLSILLYGGYTALIPLNLADNIFSFIKNMLVTVGLIIWGISIFRISSVFFKELKRRVEPKHTGMLDDLVPFLQNIAKITIFFIVLLTILSLWGVNIIPALASAGVIGVAVAFAAKDTVANLFGGISVFLDKPYKTGDYVIISDKHRGKVIQIGMRSTKIKTRDNVLLTVPNSAMVTNVVINETGFDPKLRTRIPIGLAYGTNLDFAEKVLINIARKHQEVLQKPEPIVRYRRFGESAIELELLVVVSQPSRRGRAVHELIKIIDKGLRKEGISIAYPQMDVHLYGDSQITKHA